LQRDGLIGRLAKNFVDGLNRDDRHRDGLKVKS